MMMAPRIEDSAVRVGERRFRQRGYRTGSDGARGKVAALTMRGQYEEERR